MIERIESLAPAELEALTDLWERSVRATHDFLAPEDFAAFAGVEAGKLEMLFVAPEKRGKGLGRELVEYLVAHRGVRRVDVNEQNAQAAGFYARMGFRVVSRSETDPSGRPYPILHLSL